MYKQIKKDVKETKGYGSAVTELSVTDEKRYYLFFNNALMKVKSLKDITDLLSGKWYTEAYELHPAKFPERKIRE